MRRSDRARARGVARGDAGYVTAETATVVPSLVLLVGMLLWGLAAAAGTIQRGETPAAAREAARSAAPEGAEVELARDGELVRVRVAARTSGLGPLSLPLEAEAVALAEDPIAAGSSGGLT
jgi:hypothetical protein